MAEVNDYPLDEFDRLAASRSIRGTHRRKESNLKWWLALLAIVIISPLLGWGIVNWAGTRDDPAPTATTTQAGDPTTDPSAAPTEETPTEETPTEEPEPEPQYEVDYSASVRILNGAGVAGFAAQNEASLAELGFSNTSIGDYTYGLPEDSTVYFAAEDGSATARRVAESLGIANVVMDADAAGANDVVVVLRPDLLG